MALNLEVGAEEVATTGAGLHKKQQITPSSATPNLCFCTFVRINTVKVMWKYINVIQWVVTLIHSPMVPRLSSQTTPSQACTTVGTSDQHTRPAGQPAIQPGEKTGSRSSQVSHSTLYVLSCWYGAWSVFIFTCLPFPVISLIRVSTLSLQPCNQY